MLQAGIARVDISPTKSLFLVGYPLVERYSTGVHDPIYATALVLKNDATTLVSISVDVVYIGQTQAAHCRSQIAQRTGVAADHILISATHTHSAPLCSEIVAWHGDPVVPLADPEYIEQVQNGIIEAAVLAVQNSVPARLAATTAQVEGVGCNRHHPDGPRDPEVGLLMVQKIDGTPLALHLIYGMHPTVLHEDSTQVSADFPYYTRRDLEAAFPGLIVAYHNGSCGNLSPRYHVQGQTFAEAERLGSKLAAAILPALQLLQPSDYREDIKLGAVQHWIALPFRDYPTPEQAQQDYQATIDEWERLKRENAGHGPIRTAECITFGADFTRRMAKLQAEGIVARKRREYEKVELQVLRIGDVYLAALPGEIFIEYALRIKAEAPAKTHVITMANGDTQGYIVTPGTDNYESRFSFFLPEAGDLMVREAVQMVGEAAGS